MYCTCHLNIRKPMKLGSTLGPVPPGTTTHPIPHHTTQSLPNASPPSSPHLLVALRSMPAPVIPEVSSITLPYLS